MNISAFAVPVLLMALSACSSRATQPSGISDEARPPDPCSVHGSLPDGTEIRSFSFDFVPSEKHGMVVTVDYTEPSSVIVNRTAALRAGDSFPASETYVIESIDPVPETWGDPQTGMAAVLVQQATVRHRKSGAKFLLRWDGRHCYFKSHEDPAPR